MGCSIKKRRKEKEIIYIYNNFPVIPFQNWRHEKVVEEYYTLLA
jgi:hypothetical protein